MSKRSIASFLALFLTLSAVPVVAANDAAMPVSPDQRVESSADSQSENSNPGAANSTTIEQDKTAPAADKTESPDDPFAFKPPPPPIEERPLTPGPLLDRRTEILNFLIKAKTAGIGVKPYEQALEAIEKNVKAGKSEAELRPEINKLVVALSKQVENIKTIKSVMANKALEADLAGATTAPTPTGKALAQSGFGFENGVFKIKPLSRNTSNLLDGISPQYHKYALVSGRGVPESILERILLDLTNKHRREMKLPPYSWDSRLAGLAKGHARDMAANNFFAHTNQQRQGPVERAAAAGYSFKVRENIGMAGAGRGSPVGMVILVDDGLMRSPGHRAAILDPAGKGAGMGVCYDLKNGGIKVCQVFSTD